MSPIAPYSAMGGMPYVYYYPCYGGGGAGGGGGSGGGGGGGGAGGGAGGTVSPSPLGQGVSSVDNNRESRRQQVQQQVEYYFSLENLVMDFWLRGRMADEGW